MKRLLSMLFVFVLALAVLSPAALADSGLRQYSDSELRQLYEAVRQEMNLTTLHQVLHQQLKMSLHREWQKLMLRRRKHTIRRMI